jgi:poly(A) polymerase
VVLLSFLQAPPLEYPEEDRLPQLMARLETAQVHDFELFPVADESDELDHDLDAKERARQTYVRSLDVTREVITSARLGKSPGLKRVKRAVQGIVDAILTDSSSLMGLTTLREFDEYTFVHSVNVCILSVALGRRLALSKTQLLDLGLAALLHDIGKPATRRHETDGGVSFHHHEVVGAKMVRKRMRELKYSKQMVDDVSQLVYLHLRFHGYGEGRWTDSAVRRYVADAGPLLPRLHKLVRADCTTRNKRRAAMLQANYDGLEARISELAAREDLERVRPDLDGNAIMELLGIPAGPQVGEAWNFLKELRLDLGPMGREEATA